MNEEIYNIGYDALTTIMELTDCLIENPQDDRSQYTIIHAIKKIAIQSKYIMFEKKEKANNK